MWAAVTTPQLFGHGKSHLGGDLLGAQEVFMRGLFEAAARNAPSLPSPACGGGKGGGHAAKNRWIELGAGPNLSGAAIIDHNHAHGAVGLGLQDETTVEFE